MNLGVFWICNQNAIVNLKYLILNASIGIEGGRASNKSHFKEI